MKFYAKPKTTFLLPLLYLGDYMVVVVGGRIFSLIAEDAFLEFEYLEFIAYTRSLFLEVLEKLFLFSVEFYLDN